MRLPHKAGRAKDIASLQVPAHWAPARLFLCISGFHSAEERLLLSLPELQERDLDSALGT